jgi:hypothetical protein
MTKKVLAIYYSQSGQLAEIINQFTAPLNKQGVTVEKVGINLVRNYPFPWTTSGFFSVMPNSVLGVPTELAPFELKEQAYDLIILGYQAWFLSPSIPINSLLQQQKIVALLQGTPVITITGARNMWLTAFVKLRKLLQASGARLVGNIALVDRHLNPISFVTIFHWMLNGKKDRFLRIFPLPGVSDADIKHTAVLGAHVVPRLDNNNWDGLQEDLTRAGALTLNYNLMLIESVAGKIFTLWASFIAKRKNRAAWLIVFKYYLLIAFFIGAPIVITLDAIFLRLFTPGRIKAKKSYYLNLN